MAGLGAGARRLRAVRAARIRGLVAAGVLAVLIAALVRACSGGDDEATEPARDRTPDAAPATGAPPRELAGEVVLMRFDGDRAPAYVKRILREGRASGATLFAENVRSPGQVRALTRQMQDAAGGSALVAVDQEGGVARRLPWASAPGQPDLATEDAARDASRGTAQALREAGINLNFAPVADVATGEGSAVRERAYPGDAAAVARLTAAAVQGYDGTRVAPTLKHFPGFGRATANTDDQPVLIGATRDELGTDLEPFRAGIDAGAPVVMAGHARYPAYDPAWIASQSRPVVTDLLRGELGFRGVVVTDSMEADAVLSRSDIDDAAVYAIYAGCDLLVLTGRGSQAPVYRRLVQEARRSPEFRARLAEAAGRVRALKRSLGLSARAARGR